MIVISAMKNVISVFVWTRGINWISIRFPQRYREGAAVPPYYAPNFCLATIDFLTATQIMLTKISMFTE